jgi:hypothetical protein
MSTKTEELTALARQINAARIEANRIEETAPQDGVYGDLSDALGRILALITGSEAKAADAYDALLDGAAVTDAIKSVTG